MATSKKTSTQKLGSEAILELFVSKWAIKIVHALSRGTKRHGELRRELTGVSQKMLTQTLRDLKRAGLVERMSYDLVPPKVEYSLTRLGRSFVKPLNALCRWAESHREELESAVSLKQAAGRADNVRRHSRSRRPLI